MKIITAFLLTVCVCSPKFAKASIVDVFFLAGQSNASGRVFTSTPTYDSTVPYFYRTDGPSNNDVVSENMSGQRVFTDLGPIPPATGSNHYFGPEIALANSLKTAGYNPAIIKVSDGATSLATEWNSRTSGAMWNHWKDDTAAMLSDLATNYTDVRLHAMFWMQGENDSLNLSDANAYQTNFENLVADVLTELGELGYSTSNFHFITGRIIEGKFSDGTPWPHSSTVRSAQETVMNTAIYPNRAWIDTDSFPNDDTHYDVDGIEDLGNAFAAKFGELTAVPEPSSLFLMGFLCGAICLKKWLRAGKESNA